MPLPVISWHQFCSAWRQTVLWVRMTKKPQCDHDAMVHEVCYDPANVDLQMYKIYLNPFDTGSVEQWLKFLTKLNLIITRNGLTASSAKFNLTWLLLKGEALQHFNKTSQRAWKWKKMHIMRNALVQYPDTFFQRTLGRCRSTTCERSVYTIQWPSASMWHIGISKTNILLHSPQMVEWHKRSVMMK